MTPGFKPFTEVHNSPLLTSTLFLHWIYLIENSRIQDLPFFGNTNKNGRMKWGSYISGSHKRIWMRLTDNYNDIYLEFYWQMTKDPIVLYYLQNPFWGLSSKQASSQYGKVARSHTWAARERRPEVSVSPLTRAFLRVSFRSPEMDSLLAGYGVYCNNFVKLSG